MHTFIIVITPVISNRYFHGYYFNSRFASFYICAFSKIVIFNKTVKALKKKIVRVGFHRMIERKSSKKKVAK